MDSLSQIVLGAATAEAVAGKKLGNKAMFWGAVGGTIPDLDVFIQFADPIDQLVFHRGPSHSLLFALVMAPIMGYLIRAMMGSKLIHWIIAATSGIPLIGWLVRKILQTEPASWKTWTLLYLVSIGTHPLLDSFTSWGTHLFWPFSDYRVAWNTIFVVDPAYTFPFLFCLLGAAFMSRKNQWRTRLNTIGLTISCLYLTFTVVNKARVDSIIRYSLEETNTEYVRFMSNPTPLNNILWYTIVEAEDTMYLGYYSLFDQRKVIKFLPFDKGPDIPENVTQKAHFSTILNVNKGYFLTETQGDSIFMRDFRFGIMNGADYEADQSVDPAFIFTYTIDNSDLENPIFSVIEPPRDPEEADEMVRILSRVYRRMWGI